MQSNVKREHKFVSDEDLVDFLINNRISRMSKKESPIENIENDGTHRERFINSMMANTEKALALVQRKTQDYATSYDPYKNFRMSESVGVSLERGILVRICDKISRISNLLDKESSVKDESIEDTLIDVMNYTNILLCYLQEKK